MRDFHVATVMGIPIKVNMTLLIFLPVLAWIFSRPSQIDVYAGFIGGLSRHAVDVDALKLGLVPTFLGLFTAVGLFASVLVHELGHSWVAGRYGVPIASITLWIFGGMAHIEDLPEDWNVELPVAAAGPATSALIGVGCLGLLQVVPAGPLLIFVVGWLAVVNLTLAVFNLLPAFPMDGGRMLRSLLARTRPYVEATRIAADVGKGVAVLLALYAVVVVFAPLLLLIAMFIYVAAGSESKATVVRDLLGEMTVRDVMSTDLNSVPPGITVAELTARILSEKATAFPVMDNGTFRGFVTLEDVRGVPEEQRGITRVGEMLGSPPETVAPDADAFEAMRVLSGSGRDRLAVLEGDELVGTIAHADFAAALEVTQGLGPWRQVKPPDGYA